METSVATISRLRAMRLRRGMVLQELAVLSDVSVTTLVSIEKWGHRATQDTYQKIATTLGVSIDEIIGVEEIPQEPADEQTHAIA